MNDDQYDDRGAGMDGLVEPPYVRRRMTRRGLLAAGGVTAAAGAVGAFGWGALNRNALRPIEAAPAAGTMKADVYTQLGGTDGWISLPAQGTTWHPDTLAPSPYNTYVFGFADATRYISQTDGSVTDSSGLANLKNKAQVDAPLLGYDEGTKVQIALTNLGLKVRPDLTDGHTIHWHGFKNAIPMFDGVPEMSLAAPVGRTIAFFYDLKKGTCGTYMYHCHWEDVEHVQMGMRGMVYVRPLQNTATQKFAYNDGDGSTRYDREFSLMLTDMWLKSHWEDAHIQQPDWSEFTPDAYLINGRSYPDTLLPHKAGLTGADAARLAYQPYGSLISCNAGDKVLIRMANLGYTTPAMTLYGIRLRIVGKDASWLRGHYLDTHTLRLGPGEAVDAIFTAPDVSTTTSFDFVNRNYSASISGPARGGQATRVDVHPAGTLPAQGGINQ